MQGGRLLNVALCETEPLLSANDRPTQSNQLSNHKNHKTIKVWLKLDDDTRPNLTMKTQVKKRLLRNLKLANVQSL